MRRFLSHFKKSDESIQTELPSLPFDLSYSELTYKTKRGFLARKLGQYVGLDTKDWDSLFYDSLIQVSFSQANQENQMEFILYLTERMLEWHEQQEDIALKIKSLDISTIFQNAMLKAYEIHKKDLFFRDTSSYVQEKRQSIQEEQIGWKIYRDVMFAATQGQFLLITEDEIGKYKSGCVLCEGTIKESSDIPKCRNAAKESFEKMELNKAKVMSWLLVLSEAITNTIKHAEEGKMTLVKSDEKNEVYFVIEDKGPGFALEDLPKKTLLAGYSTKKSLGQGFTLMMKMAKQILLCNSPIGSTIILIFNVENGKEG